MDSVFTFSLLRLPAFLVDFVIIIVAAPVVGLALLRHLILSSRTIINSPYVFGHAYLGDLRRVALLDCQRVHEVLLLVIRPEVGGVIFVLFYLFTKFRFQNV